MSYIGRQNLGGAYRQLDDISSGFDGSDTTHTMQVNSQNVTVGDVNQVILSLGGVIQKPGTDFTVSGSTLTFTTAPASGLSFFAILLGSDNGGTVTPTDASVTASKLAIAGGEVKLDADGDTSITADTDDQIDFKVGGTDILNITNSSSDAVISSMANDKDIIFKGQDGGSTITAFTLDMSAGGEAELRNGLTLADGDLTVASGHGINFAAAAGGTYADASGMASELLDDYEEGTWTGTFRTAAGHYTMQSSYTTGFYTRIGNIVSVTAYLAGQSESLDDGHSVLIDGLPYVADAANSGYQAIAVGYANSLNSTAGYNIAGYTNKNTNQIQLTRFDLAGGTSSMTVGELTEDGEILFSCTYRVV